MPHIHAYIPVNCPVQMDILRKYGHRIRLTVAQTYGYDANQVVLYGHIITREELQLSDNVPDFELSIDIGAREDSFSEADAQKLVDALGVAVPGMLSTSYGVWIRSMTSNGFAEHTPNK